MKITILIIVTSALLLAGCGGYKEWLQKFVPNDEDAFARRFIELVRVGRIDDAANMLDSGVRTADTPDGLAQIQQILNQGEPVNIEVVGINWVMQEGRTRSYLTYQIQFPKSWALASVIVDKAGSELFLLGIQLNPLEASLGEINAFTLTGKSLLHYLFLAIVIFIPLFLIYTVVLIIRSNVRRKWLWILFVFLGICQFSLNWTTGEFGFQPIYFHVPSVGLYRPGLYAPWFLFASLPIGAIIFLIKRKKLESRHLAQQSDEGIVL